MPRHAPSRQRPERCLPSVRRGRTVPRPSGRRLSQSTGAKATRAFLSRLPDDGIDVTFDPAIATAERRLEFISLHHPIVRALSMEDELLGEASCCGAIRLDLDLPSLDPHGFFVFELQAHGMKDELELAAVIIDKRGDVISSGTSLLATLDSARDLELDPRPSPDAVDRMYSTALDWVTADVAAREQDLQARNDEAVTAQVESLRLSSDRRRLWLREQIEAGRAAPIVRMRRAQLNRLETEVETKLARLEAKRRSQRRLPARGSRDGQHLDVIGCASHVAGSGSDARSRSRSTVSLSSDAISPGRSVANRLASAEWYQRTSSGSTSICVHSCGPRCR